MVVTMPPLDIRQPPEGGLELLILVWDGTDNKVHDKYEYVSSTVLILRQARFLSTSSRHFSSRGLN